MFGLQECYLLNCSLKAILLKDHLKLLVLIKFWNFVELQLKVYYKIMYRKLVRGDFTQKLLYSYNWRTIIKNPSTFTWEKNASIISKSNWFNAYSWSFLENNCIRSSFASLFSWNEYRKVLFIILSLLHRCLKKI